jgi:hypothetical protein
MGFHTNLDQLFLELNENNKEKLKEKIHKLYDESWKRKGNNLKNKINGL